MGVGFIGSIGHPDQKKFELCESQIKNQFKSRKILRDSYSNSCRGNLVGKVVNRGWAS